MLSFNIMKTQQFNIRLDKNLIYDMELICKILNVDRNAWIKTKLAEMIYEEKIKMISWIESEFLRGKISEKEYEKKLGIKVNDELREMKRIHQKYGKKAIIDMVERVGK